MNAIRRTVMLLCAVIIALPAFAHDECTVNLNGTQSVPPNDSPNTGTADLTLTGRVLHFEITWTGLTGDFVGTHFHYAAAGENGPVVFDIGPFVEGNSAQGIWVLTNDELEDLEAGEIYVNVHSTTFPGGEIRAQLNCDFHVHPGQHGGGGEHGEGEDTCRVALSGGNSVPPNDSPNTGTGSFSLSEEGDTLFFDVTWSGLTGDFVGAHIHYAEEGENGPIVFDLGPFVNGNSAMGWWVMSDEDMENLRNEELYVNVHSSTYPDGEIRAQLDCEFEHEGEGEGDENEPCDVELSGENSVPPNDSPNSGTGVFRLSDDRDTLYFNVTWSGLEGDFAGIHFHYAEEGENGPIVFDIGPFVNGNSAVGAWAIPEDDLEDLLDGEIYVNVHSTTYPGGEIRGQLDCEFGEDDDRAGGGGAPPRGSVLDSGPDANSVTDYALQGNYPNPFNPETQIAFDLKESGLVKLTVYDILGQQVATLVNQPMDQGRHTVTFSGAGLPSGLYLYRLEANGFTAQRKMMLLK